MASEYTSTIQDTDCYFPNKMGAVVLLSMEEVMGRNGVNAILNLARLQDRIENYPPNNFDKAFSFDELGKLFQALDEMYGPRSGRGLARRIGQACFRVGVKDFGPMLSVADFAFRILPLSMRLKIGFEVMIQMLNKYTDQVARVEEDDQYYHWIMESCGACWGRKSSSPCCYLVVGILEEALYWASGGKSFYVEEVSCIAAGERTCTVLVGKRPLE